jgi:hypothetical protein
MPCKNSAGKTSIPPPRSKREAIRKLYRPPTIKILFVGEAPPASGRFFYNQDSGLYRAMRDAFHSVDESINDDNFLSAFRSAGCYLIDACTAPVDRMDRRARQDACLASEHVLSRQIRRLQPETIVSLLRSISSNVKRAALQASWRGTILDLPYPGRWFRHREVFLEELVPRLKPLLAADLADRVKIGDHFGRKL